MLRGWWERFTDGHRLAEFLPDAEGVIERRHSPVAGLLILVVALVFAGAAGVVGADRGRAGGARRGPDRAGRSGQAHQPSGRRARRRGPRRRGPAGRRRRAAPELRCRAGADEAGRVDRPLADQEHRDGASPGRGCGRRHGGRARSRACPAGADRRAAGAADQSARGAPEPRPGARGDHRAAREGAPVRGRRDRPVARQPWPAQGAARRDRRDWPRRACTRVCASSRSNGS